jgi:hypothetical protein
MGSIPLDIPFQHETVSDDFLNRSGHVREICYCYDLKSGFHFETRIAFDSLSCDCLLLQVTFTVMR